MFNSLNSSRFNRTIRAAGLAVTIAALATACGSTTDTSATQAGVALPGLINVTESSSAITDTTAPIAEVESETSGAEVAETPAATESDAAAPADEPAGHTEQQPADELPSTSTQPPAQPDAPTPGESTAPTPADPTNALEIPEGAIVEVLGSNRLPGPNGEGTVFDDCYDSDGKTYPHDDIVIVDPYGPGAPTRWICDDGMWRKTGGGGSDTTPPLEDPSDEGPQIELDQADVDPPTDVFEAPVSS